jgi:cbb3-type cytochrome oxidase subunit 3
MDLSTITSNPVAIVVIVLVVALVGYVAYAYTQKKWPFSK